MAESIQHLEDQLRAKERELDSVGNKLAGATVGAALTQGLTLGAAAGAYLGREKNKRAQLEREVETLKQKIKDNQNQISRLHTKKSQLQNEFQDQKVRYEADMRQKRTDLERQKQNEQDPAKVRALDEQLSRLQGDINTKEQQNLREHEKELDAIQREIDSLTF